MTLPYQDFPPDVRRLTPRTTLSGAPESSLVGINTTHLPDGAFCFVQGVGSDYLFRKESTATPSGDDVIEPTVGGGRWFKQAGALLPGDAALVIRDSVAASGAQLQAIDTTDATDWPDGITAFVLTVEDYFTLSRSSALTADGITVIAPTTGPGRWLRKNIASPRWAKQAAWFIDSVNGNDENDGSTSGTELRTHAELQRRWGPAVRIAQDTTVTIEENFDLVVDTTALVDVVLVQDVNLGSQPTLSYVGVPSTAESGTLTAATTLDPATNTPQQVTGDFLDNTDQRVRLTANDALAWIAVGADDPTASRVTSFVLPDGTGFEPVGSEAYSVETLPLVFGLTFQVRGMSCDGSAPGLFVNDLRFGRTGTTSAFKIDSSACDKVALRGCQIDYSTFDARDSGRVILSSCFLNGQSDASIPGLNVHNVELSGCLAKHAVAGGVPLDIAQGCDLSIGGEGTVLISTLVQGGNGGRLREGATLSLATADGGGQGSSDSQAALGIMDSVASGLQIDAGATFSQLPLTAGATPARLFGAGNTDFGVTVAKGGLLSYQAAATKPTITGTAGDAEVAALTGVPLAWATDIPLHVAGGGIMESTASPTRGEFIQRGSGTLVAGVLTVGFGGDGSRVFVLGADSIQITRGVAAGATIGSDLQVSARTPGAPGVGSFTVRAIDTTGALVATDVSSFDWAIIN